MHFFTKRSLGPGRRLRARLDLEHLETRTLPSVYTPAQIVNAYGFNQIAFSGGIKGDGTGQTIAIVDAYYDPTIKNDLSTFSRQYGLPQLDGIGSDGLFKQVDLSHGTRSPVGDDWTLETALDVEWAHAVAPRANIVLVEAASDNQDASGKPTDLLAAVQTAASYTVNGSAVSVVSTSWGINEVPGETSWDSTFNVPGVTFVAASGDSGAGTIWPAVSPYVVSVGGTTLNLSRTNTISSETGWGYGNWSFLFGGSGGGFSQYEPLPSFQSGITTGVNGYGFTQFQARLNPDVAYDADPDTGYQVYDGVDGGWNVVGGTSAGAPQWAALLAIADQGRKLGGQSPLDSTQTLNALYSNPKDFHDITKGSTGEYEVIDNYGNVTGYISVRAASGYDLVTGLGSPVANALVPALVEVTSAAKRLATGSSSVPGPGNGPGSGKQHGAGGFIATPILTPLTAAATLQAPVLSASISAAAAVPQQTPHLLVMPPARQEVPPVSFTVCPVQLLVEPNEVPEEEAPSAMPAAPLPVPERPPAPRPGRGNPAPVAPNPEALSQPLHETAIVATLNSAGELIDSSPPAASLSLAGAAAVVSMGYGGWAPRPREEEENRRR